MDSLKPGDALLVVDVQKDFCAGGALDVPEGDSVVPVLNRWIHRAEAARVPIILTRDWHPANHISFQDRGGPWPPHCVQGTPGAAFHGELHIPESSILIDKADDPEKESYSGFGNTHLDECLREMRVRRVWIGGLALDYCVLETALDAVRRGMEVHVIQAATRAVNVNAGDADRSIERLERAGVIVEAGDLT